jgi:hypothetical protein
MTGTDMIDFFMKDLAAHKVDKGDSYTHVLSDKPYGCYRYEDNEYDDFLDNYVAAIKQGMKISLLEKQRNEGQLIFDFDFNQKKGKRYYTDVTFRNVTRAIFKIINKLLKVPEHKMIAYIFEKEKPSLNDGNYKDGFHIMFPHIIVKANMRMIIRKQLIDIIEKRNLFEDIKYTNSIENVVDESVLMRNSWALYGSSGGSGKQTYIMTEYYQYSIEHKKLVELNEPIKLRELVKLFAVRTKRHPMDIIKIKDDVDL